MQVGEKVRNAGIWLMFTTHLYQSRGEDSLKLLDWIQSRDDALLQRNEPGDREKAMSLLDESLAISRELGMRPLMERVLSRWEILRA